jgi:hypothetical protein
MPLKDQFGKKISQRCNVLSLLIYLKVWKKGNSKQSCRLPDSMSQGVDFRLRISPRIRNQNLNGWKGSIRDLYQTDLCKNIGKTGSLPCPFKTFPPCYSQSPLLRILLPHNSKIQNGRHKQRSGQHTLYHAKKIYKEKKYWLYSKIYIGRQIWSHNWKLINYVWVPWFRTCTR